MKNLANCKPSEFLRQTNLIRKSVQNWLEITDILNIRQRKPDFAGIPEDDKEARQKALEKQARENLNDMLEAMLEMHPDETLEILALVCFIDPKDADNHKVGEYLSAISEMLADENVIHFFSLLMRLEQTPTSSASKA